MRQLHDKPVQLNASESQIAIEMQEAYLLFCRRSHFVLEILLYSILFLGVFSLS